MQGFIQMGKRLIKGGLHGGPPRKIFEEWLSEVQFGLCVCYNIIFQISRGGGFWLGVGNPRPPPLYETLLYNTGES